MARIQFVSDLHFEFLTSPEVIALADRLVEADERADTLLLCGDITTTNKQNVNKLINFYKRLKPYYDEILHIAGNHEYYHVHEQPGYADTVFKQLASDLDDYYYLKNEVFTTKERAVIAGTTLWFDWDNPNVLVYRDMINDFNYISGKDVFLKAENEAAKAFLASIEPHTIDILMTHHGVTPKCDPKFASNPANIYYYTDITHEIERISPQYAMHGHTHDVLDYDVDNTHVVTNPYGYNGKTKQFNPSFIVYV